MWGVFAFWFIESTYTLPFHNIRGKETLWSLTCVTGLIHESISSWLNFLYLLNTTYLGN